MHKITADELETMVKAREILDKYKHPAKTWVMAFLHNAVVDSPPCVCDERPAWGVIDCPVHGTVNAG